MKPLFSSALLRTQSDERLLALVGDGQERAFEAIVHRYRRPLERYCSRALSRSQGEDVVQQVLMKAWEALNSGAEVRSLKPWLFRIAQTTILDTVQQPGFEYHVLAGSLSPLEGPDSEFEKRAVIRQTLMGVAALPDAQREALLRTAVDGQSRAEIAAALGVSEGAVRQLLYRARASLRSVVTAVTPITFVSWLARPAEVGGLAKASAIVAGAGVVAAGPVAVHELPLTHPEKPRTQIERPVAPQSRVQLGTVRRAPASPSYQARVAVTKSRELWKERESSRTRKRGKSAERDDEPAVAVPAREDAHGQPSDATEQDQGEAREGSSRPTRRARGRVRDGKAGARKQARSNVRDRPSPPRKTSESDTPDEETVPKEKVDQSPSVSEPGVPADKNAKGPPDKEAKSPQHE